MIQNLKNLLSGEPIEPYDGEIRPSVLCYAVVPWTPEAFNTIEPLSYDPKNPESGKYCLRGRSFTNLCKELTSIHKPPHYELGIRSDEVLFLQKAKLRPVVVLTSSLSDEAKAFPSHFKGCVICAPLYTLVNQDGTPKVGYNPNTIEDVTALKYRCMFPVPGSAQLKSNLSGLRLDRILVVRTECLTPPKKRISNRWFSYIAAWIWFFTTGKLVPGANQQVAEELHNARQLLLEALAKHRGEAPVT